MAVHNSLNVKWYLILLPLALSGPGCGSDQQQSQLESIVIEVTGDEFNWHFRYPGPDGILGNSDDRHSVQDLFLPAKSKIDLKLASNDYVYMFSLPELGLKEIAVPGLSFEMHFTTQDEQTLQLMGDQMCGFAHESLIGKVYVRSQDDGYYDW